jgi:hypothetical protein
MGSSYMICNDERGVSSESDMMISIQMIYRGRGDLLGVPFLSKFDETSLFGATVSSLMAC